MTTAAYPATLDVTAVIPGTADQLGVLRTLVRSYATEFDASIDRLDDCALAVTEAAAHIIEHARPQRLMVGLGENDGSLAISVIGEDSEAEAWPVEAWENSMASDVLAALTTSLDVALEEPGPAFHLTIALGS